jgi:hypothetical protein
MKSIIRISATSLWRSHPLRKTNRSPWTKSTLRTSERLGFHPVTDHRGKFRRMTTSIFARYIEEPDPSNPRKTRSVARRALLRLGVNRYRVYSAPPAR